MLGHNFPYHPPIDIGKPEIASGITIGKLLMIEAQKVENRSVQIVHMNLVFHCPEAEFVSFSIGHAPTYTAPRQEHAESIMIMIPAVPIL